MCTSTDCPSLMDNDTSSLATTPYNIQGYWVPYFVSKVGELGTSNDCVAAVLWCACSAESNWTDEDKRGVHQHLVAGGIHSCQLCQYPLSVASSTMMLPLHLALPGCVWVSTKVWSNPVAPAVLAVETHPWLSIGQALYQPWHTHTPGIVPWHLTHMHIRTLYSPTGMYRKQWGQQKHCPSLHILGSSGFTCYY